MSTIAVGIDLGTTNSAIAYVNQHGVPEVLPNAEGDRITPSVILFDGNEVVVGTYAKQSAVAFPEQIVEFVKRAMGSPDPFFEYDGQKFSPEKLSSFILAKLKHDAEQRLGQKVTQAVITVPAYFGHKERQATIRAGEAAGLKVLKLLNEPTAAAFAYGLETDDRQRKVLVFDLGGGTFDVTIVELAGNDINVVATNGDHQLGGKDWDDMLIKHVAAKFEEKHGVNPLEDLAAYHDLRAKCVSAKISLTKRPKVNVFFDYKGNILRVAVTREEFEDLAGGLMGRVRALTLDVIDDAGLKCEDIHTVLLAGGSTRMPMCRELIAELFGQAPATDINPDECVALGAALTAALEAASLAGEDAPIDIRTHDVTSHSLGMVVYEPDGKSMKNAIIIKRNSRIPCDITKDNFVNTHDSQTAMDLWLLQGENPDPLECSVLAHFDFYGLPPRPKTQSKIGVTYRYNANGIVEVEAMDLNTGQTLAYRLASGQVGLEDVATGRVPMNIVLVMDCSGSMYGRNITEARRAAFDFVVRTMEANHRVGVVAAPGGIKIQPTRDIKAVDKALKQLVPIGATPTHEGIGTARALLAQDAGVHAVYVVVTDGHPDNPEATLTECHEIRRSGGRVIVIGVGKKVNQKYLESLCSAPTDYHPARESFELTGAFINLATELGA